MLADALKRFKGTHLHGHMAALHLPAEVGVDPYQFHCVKKEGGAWCEDREHVAWLKAVHQEIVPDGFSRIISSASMRSE
jgi:hypothetical protein